MYINQAKIKQLSGQIWSSTQIMFNIPIIHLQLCKSVLSLKICCIILQINRTWLEHISEARKLFEEKIFSLEMNEAVSTYVLGKGAGHLDGHFVPF